jgi:hypothetical protein
VLLWHSKYRPGFRGSARRRAGPFRLKVGHARLPASSSLERRSPMELHEQAKGMSPAVHR